MFSLYISSFDFNIIALKKETTWSSHENKVLNHKFFSIDVIYELIKVLLIYRFEMIRYET